MPMGISLQLNFSLVHRFPVWCRILLFEGMMTLLQRYMAFLNQCKITWQHLLDAASHGMDIPCYYVPITTIKQINCEAASYA